VNIRQATTAYENWLRKTCPAVVESELQFKHREMRKDPFLFFRATYYRWAQLWTGAPDNLWRGPEVLAAGDLHVDSFGTWRDTEGRLCWGVDDFDECWPLPYTNDLVRLATSAKIVATLEQLSITLKDACAAILDGYSKALQSGGSPFVLAERDHFVEKLGIKAIKPATGFWDRLDCLPVLRTDPPPAARQALRNILPERLRDYKIVRRRAGTGSLGQERLVAMGHLDGGWIAREIKATRPSVSAFLERRGRARSYYQEALDTAVRSRDPFQTVSGGWITRRLSPDSNPIEIADLPKERDEEKFLAAMGAEVANIHLGRKRQTAHILKDLRNRKATWLASAARQMAKVVSDDWKEYRRQ
jgi:hypothetical protein